MKGTARRGLILSKLSKLPNIFSLLDQARNSPLNCVMLALLHLTGNRFVPQTP